MKVASLFLNSRGGRSFTFCSITIYTHVSWKETQYDLDAAVSNFKCVSILMSAGMKHN